MQTMCLLLMGAPRLMMIHNFWSAKPLGIFGAACDLRCRTHGICARARAHLLIGLPITQVRAGGKANKFRSLPNQIPTTYMYMQWSHAQIKPATSLFEILSASAPARRLSLPSANICFLLFAFCFFLSQMCSTRTTKYCHQNDLLTLTFLHYME
jgi:hypothetical protein